MTAHRDLKNIVRDRMVKTGESYAAARVHVMRARAEHLGLPVAPPVVAAVADTVEAIVLKVNLQSARVRILGEDGEVTFRASGVCRLVPGHLATLTMKRRWTHRGYAYASGSVKDARIDIPRLGLVPLPLEDRGLEDFSGYEPYRRPEPYAPLWKRLTRRPRPSFAMHPIAWDAVAVASADADVAPGCDAADLARAGDVDGARELLMDILARDLRCIDAHVHLGHLVFDRSPTDALVHYEIAKQIGELSLGPSFDGVLLWGIIYNRPFLRCLHGYGLCLWRLGRPLEAEQVFERILSLNPNDNQGVRECWLAVRNGGTWEAMSAVENQTLH
jgi:hypothetical protein